MEGNSPNTKKVLSWWRQAFVAMVLTHRRSGKGAEEISCFEISHFLFPPLGQLGWLELGTNTWDSHPVLSMCKLQDLGLNWGSVSAQPKRGFARHWINPLDKSESISVVCFASTSSCQVASVVSDSVWRCGLQPARLLHPWDSPCKDTGYWSGLQCPPPGAPMLHAGMPPGAGPEEKHPTS